MSRVRVLVGTHKGAFVLSADGKRDRWDVSGPHFPGCEISDVAGSAAQPNRLYAAQNDGAAGPQIHRSESGGLTWDSLGTMPARICQLVTALGDPDTVYAVGEDGAVLRSNDRGESWDELAGLREHAGGTAQPSILLDPGKPNRMYASLDTGAFRSDDAGETWKQIRAGTPVYRIAVHASNPLRVYAKTAAGVLRSGDAGETWEDVTGPLPSAFGYPIEVHAKEAETIYVVPLKSELEDYPADGKLRVYRSRAGGAKWDPLTTGLPQRDVYVGVMRNALCVDTLDPCGIYFGTTGGTVYGSNDAGESWMPIVQYFPPVSSVNVQTLA